MACNSPIVHVVDGSAWANSRDVAAYFDKRHDNVLRDIDNVLRDIESVDLPSDLRCARFIETTYDDGNGRHRRAVEMNRDAFTVLAMRFTGEKALHFQLRYIHAFNEMEKSLRARLDGSADMATAMIRLADAQREMAGVVSGIAEFHKDLVVKVGDHDERLWRLEKAEAQKRQPFSIETRRVLLEDSQYLGGMCPCCSVNKVVERNGERQVADYDHFYACSKNKPEEGWLICKQCHVGLTSGRVARHTVQSHFDSFQKRRLNIPGRQQKLFG